MVGLASAHTHQDAARRQAKLVAIAGDTPASHFYKGTKTNNWALVPSSKLQNYERLLKINTFTQNAGRLHSLLQPALRIWQAVHIYV